MKNTKNKAHNRNKATKEKQPKIWKNKGHSTIITEIKSIKVILQIDCQKSGYLDEMKIFIGKYKLLKLIESNVNYIIRFINVKFLKQ